MSARTESRRPPRHFRPIASVIGVKSEYVLSTAWQQSAQADARCKRGAVVA